MRATAIEQQDLPHLLSCRQAGYSAFCWCDTVYHLRSSRYDAAKYNNDILCTSILFNYIMLLGTQLYW
jgi:hypothetical protein